MDESFKKKVRKFEHNSYFYEIFLYKIRTCDSILLLNELARNGLTPEKSLPNNLMLVCTSCRPC